MLIKLLKIHVHFQNELKSMCANSCSSSTLEAETLDIWCDGDSSCTNSTLIMTPSNFGYIECTSRSFSDIKANSQAIFNGFTNTARGSFVSFQNDVAFILIYGFGSFNNATVRCGVSTFNNSDYAVMINKRRIDIYGYGSFGMYNSTVISNGNDLNVFSYGYYNGYGLTVNCSKPQDTCVIYCVGTSCILIQH